MQLTFILHRLVFMTICSMLLTVTVSYSQDDDSLEKWALGYAEDLSSSNWAEIVIEKYGWNEDGVKGHKEFRDAFADYKAEVKYLLVDGTEVVMWNTISAKHVKKFPYAEMKGLEPSGKEVTWTEIWYFEKTDGKFVDKWDMLVDGVGRMKQLGIECLPKE